MKPDSRILALLAREGPALTAREIGQITGLWIWRLYPALTRLERNGRVLGYEGGDRPARVYYQWRRV